MNEEEILSFIKHFTAHGPDVIDCFSNGNCYWFAQILQKRFQKYNAYIVYSPVDNHFATVIKNKIYDITGAIDDLDILCTNWRVWKTYYAFDPAHARRLRRDCIDFT